MTPVLTDEEKAAALQAALDKKTEREKGTSVEVTEHDKVILEMSPEMQRALETNLETALKTIFKKEVDKRQKEHGESFSAAFQNVQGAVETFQMKKARERKENEITARWFSGLFLKDVDTMKRALEDETKYLGRETRVAKKMTERAMGAATAGDEFVPEVFTTRVIENIARYGLLRRFATIIPMVTDTYKFPVISTGLTAYEVSAGSQITASDLVTTSVTLSQRKFATITAMHNELLKNADPAIVPIIVDQAGRALSYLEDYLAFTGTGSTVAGILESSTNAQYLGASSTSGKTAISNITFDDFALLISALDSQYINNNCKFYLNKIALYYLQLLKNSADYYWKPASAANPGTIHGFNYETSAVLPSAPSVNTAFMFYGDLSQFYLGDRESVAVTIGTEGTVGSDNLFEKDMSAVRVTELVGLTIADAEGFAPLKTAAS